MTDLDPEAFDSIMSDVDSSSFVVTAAGSDDVAGCLVAFTTQCSMQPPRFGVWLSKLNRTYRVAQSGGTLVVHLLRRGDDEFAARFGGETGDEVDKFAGIDWTPGPDGCPVITGLDWFAGTVIDRVDTGDHVGFILEPIAGQAERSRDELGISEVGDIEAGHPVPGD